MGKFSIWSRAIKESYIKKITSKLRGVASGKIHNMGRFLVNVAQNFQRMPQSFCLNVHAKRDLEQESKKVLEI